MSVRWFVPVLLVLPILGRSAGAEEKPIVLQPAQAELGFSFVLQEGDWGNGVTLTGRCGYFVTDHHEVGPIGSVIYSHPNEGYNYWGGTAGLFYRYNFGTYRRFVIPYAGFSTMWAFGDARQATSYVMQIESGVRLMLSSSAAVNIGMVYQRERITYAQPDLQRTFAIVSGISVFLDPLFSRATSSQVR